MKTIKTEGDINNSPLRAEWEKGHSALTKDFLKRDSSVFLHQSLSTPCLDVLEECHGTLICNLNGKKYLDFHGNSVHQGGFKNPFIIKAVKNAIDSLSFCSRRFTNRYAIECAEKLVKKGGKSFSRVLFSTSGTAANGIALKIARLVTGKHKVVSFWDSFHGASLDMISVGGEAQFKKNMGPMMSGVFHIPPPDKNGLFGEKANELLYADYFDYICEKETDIGAFIAEPFRCTEVKIPSKKYWKRIREICDKRGVLLIFDEIPTALYRTGSFYAFKQFEIIPDIITLGKGLGGGIIPFSAVVTKEEFNIGKDISLGHYTHEKSPLGAAAALGLFQWFDNADISNRVKQINRLFLQLLNDIKVESKAIQEIRSKGAFFGIDIENENLAEKILYSSLEKGLSYKVSNGKTITLAPPLSVSDDELIKASEIIAESIIENY